ncbi:hypothetical protein INR49_008937 [Caranx melampygus]|nr:hypothetical protein INR49_008937 [Caranx melampygus]
MYYNRLEYLRFDSRVDKFIGYTQHGVKNAQRLNSGPELAQFRAERERYCVNNVNNDYQVALTKSAPPPPPLETSCHVGLQRLRLLPKQIRVSWTRDGQEVSSDVTSTEELADADWYYQIHSHLEYTPRLSVLPLLDWMNTWFSKPGPELSSDTQLVQTWSRIVL